MMTKLRTLATTWILSILGCMAPANASDLHIDYYYPKPTSQEVYASSATKSIRAAPRSRAAFAVGMAGRQSKLAYPPDFHLFVKGEHLQKMIIVAVQTNRYNSLYRMRALLASLTSLARGTPVFAEAPDPHRLNFFDFCKLMGFTQITISDGDKLAHQILIR